jgi:hypothetical protein
MGLNTDDDGSAAPSSSDGTASIWDRWRRPRFRIAKASTMHSKRTNATEKAMPKMGNGPNDTLTAADDESSKSLGSVTAPLALPESPEVVPSDDDDDDDESDDDDDDDAGGDDGGDGGNGAGAPWPLMSNKLTSKRKVAPGGITLPAPRAP